MNKTREEVLKNLLGLKYFNHATDLNEAIKQTFDNYKEDGIINFPESLINRIFNIDAEFNFESEGLKDTIADFIKLLNFFGLKLKINAYDEKFEDKSGYYKFRKVKINDKNYVIKNISDWGESFISSIHLLNKILDDNNVDEHIFSLFLDESSNLILLTKEQFKYLDELIPNDAKYKPKILLGDNNLADNDLEIKITYDKELVSLLEKTKEERIKKLDLTEFGLKYLPKEVVEMDWLEELILGATHFKFNSRLYDFTNPCTLIELPKEISKLKNLRKLILGGGIHGHNKAKILDYSPIWSLKNLEFLGLSSTSIDNIRGIEKLQKLKTLYIDFNDNNIDFSAISELYQLETIQLENVGITSIEFLKNLKNLKTISIGSNKITSLKPLNNHTQIIKICCCNNRIKDDTFLSNCKNLKYVCIKNTKMENIISKIHSKVHLNT